jgi:hypothetical protein
MRVRTLRVAWCSLIHPESYALPFGMIQLIEKESVCLKASIGRVLDVRRKYGPFGRTVYDTETERARFSVFRLLLCAIAAIFRPRALLIAENLCLRQRLLVLQRRRSRPCLSDADRRFWILASRWFGGWRHPLRIVKPETVLRWHRQGWKVYWTWRSRREVRADRHSTPQELQGFTSSSTPWMSSRQSFIQSAKWAMHAKYP